MVKAKSCLENISPIDKDENKKQWRLKLDKNENIYGVSNFIVSTIKNIDNETISHYSNNEKLINKLSQYYNIDNSQIEIYSGSNDATRIIFSAYLENQDEILANYNLSNEIQNLSQCFGAIIKNINFKNFKLNVENFKNYITDKTKIFYCATPDNNTGVLFKPSLLEFLVQNFPNILFVINCSYINYAQNTNLEDYLDLVKKYNNVVVIKSFSHDYALAGLRISFICASKDIINNLRKIDSGNTNSVALECAYCALNNDSVFEEIKIQNDNARELLHNGLIEKGFKPIQSEANFILCNFLNYTDFYYRKLKNNGVIVKRYDEDSPYSSYLRITVPKIGGVKYILELLKKKDILIFNPDGIIFDTNDSVNEAIIQTFKHFAGYTIKQEEIMHAKNMGGYNFSWNIIKYLLEKHNIHIEINDIAKVFQNIFYNPNNKEGDFLINKEKLLFSKENLEELCKKYDLILFSDRQDFELKYSLEKFEIDRFFDYIITVNNLEYGHFKPNPQGVYEILGHCPHNSAKYIGNTVNDIIAGNKANVYTIGFVIFEESKSVMINNFKHLCANNIIENKEDILNFLFKNEQN